MNSKSGSSPNSVKAIRDKNANEFVTLRTFLAHVLRETWLNATKSTFRCCFGTSEESIEFAHISRGVIQRWCDVAVTWRHPELVNVGCAADCSVAAAEGDVRDEPHLSNAWITPMAIDTSNKWLCRQKTLRRRTTFSLCAGERTFWAIYMCSNIKCPVFGVSAAWLLQYRIVEFHKVALQHAEKVLLNVSLVFVIIIMQNSYLNKLSIYVTCSLGCDGKYYLSFAGRSFSFQRR